MQEEIEQKSFNIMISTTKLSARTVLRAVKAAFRLYQSKASQGKQSVRTLLRQNRGVSSVEISKTGIRGLERYAKKYGIGSGFRKDASELEKLLAFADDETVLGELTAVKKANKEALADWLLRTQNVKVNTEAVFDIQSKRLHEYKRQQLNLLYLIHKYYEIKAGHLPAAPLVSIFGAKAAPAYIIAKDIIHALLTLSKVIAADPEVSKWLQVHAQFAVVDIDLRARLAVYRDLLVVDPNARCAFQQRSPHFGYHYERNSQGRRRGTAGYCTGDHAAGG